MAEGHRATSMEALGRLDPHAFVAAEKLPLRFVLDQIRSGLNVGSVFRTADAFRLEGIDLCGYTARPPHRDILKTALGAADHVTWSGHEHTVEAIRELQQKGVRVFALEQASNSIALDQWSPLRGERWAIVLGNEARGCTEEVLAAVDGVLEIPQFGVKHSLNVSVAAGMVCWQAYRSMGPPVG
ncbi:MAG: TrmH family RNA methyltransferase [Flavobacteriales bacterium]|nr:TrmH family RNA methyltransferase [Flavobacteriales bacterium]